MEWIRRRWAPLALLGAAVALLVLGALLLRTPETDLDDRAQPTRVPVTNLDGTPVTLPDGTPVYEGDESSTTIETPPTVTPFTPEQVREALTTEKSILDRAVSKSSTQTYRYSYRTKTLDGDDLPVAGTARLERTPGLSKMTVTDEAGRSQTVWLANIDKRVEWYWCDTACHSSSITPPANDIEPGSLIAAAQIVLNSTDPALLAFGNRSGDASNSNTWMTKRDVAGQSATCMVIEGVRGTKLYRTTWCYGADGQIVLFQGDGSSFELTGYGPGPASLTLPAPIAPAGTPWSLPTD